MGGAATLDGRRFVNRRINQPKIGCYGGGALLMRRDRGGTRGVDYFLPFWGGERGDQREREGLGLGLKRPPLAEPMHQPTENSTSDGADIWDEIRPRRNIGGGRLPVDFDGYSRDEKLNEKINSVAVHGHQKTKRHTTTNRKTVSVMGGSVITRWDRGGTYGVTISRRLGWRMMRQKIKKINQIVVFGGRRTTILHNNQPKTCMPDGGGIIKDAQPDGYVRGARSHRFRGDQVGRRLKNEIK